MGMDPAYVVAAQMLHPDMPPASVALMADPGFTSIPRAVVVATYWCFRVHPFQVPLVAIPLIVAPAIGDRGIVIGLVVGLAVAAGIFFAILEVCTVVMDATIRIWGAPSLAAIPPTAP